MPLKPLNIISNASLASDERLKLEFMSVMESLYRFEIFKPFLDLCASLAHRKRLQFSLQPKKFYTIDEGNCLTLLHGQGSDAYYSYVITIKKISAEVIIHEITHMVEKEGRIKLDNLFMQASLYDLQTQHSGNVALNALMVQVMVKELELYPRDHHPPELFARFFQVLAMSKDIIGYAYDSGHKIQDVYKAFPNLISWFGEIAYPLFMKKIDVEIAEASMEYIVPLENIKHNWAGSKVKSVYGQKLSPPSPGAGNAIVTKSASKWSKAVKPLH